MYIIVGVKHFLTPTYFMAIVPPGLHYKLEIVLVSGAIEIILGILLIFKKTRKIGALGIMLLLIAVFPANIYLCVSDIAREAIGITKNQAYFRAPFQIPLVILSYWHSQKKTSKVFNKVCIIIFIPTIIYFVTI